MKTVASLAVLILLSAMCGAELKWDKRQLEFRPSPTDLEAKGVFAFTNTGTRPVLIKTITPECGCTTATLAKTTYLPGEKGELVAIFTFGQREGDQTKRINLEIDGEKEPVILTLLTHIPTPVKINPNFVYWQAGEPPLPKTMDLTVVEKSALQIKRISSSNSRISASFTTIREGQEYRISVVPKDTAADVMAVLTIEMSLATGGTRNFQAYAQVKPPVAATESFPSGAK